MGGPYRDGATFQIVGVVGNVSQNGLDSEPMPEIYFPYSQAASRAAVIMIRTTASPELLESAVRRHLAAIDRNLAIESLRPFEQTVAASLARRRFSTLLLAAFAALAMLLAAVGIYGLLNYWVRIRHDEIAIRMALGAPGYAILSWIGGQALRLVVAGMALGVLGAWMASRWMASLVFGISARNPGAMLAAALAVLAIAVIAAALPAWRAVQVDAAGRLRHT
jgi:putative ABC transport system permease protein